MKPFPACHGYTNNATVCHDKEVNLFNGPKRNLGKANLKTVCVVSRGSRFEQVTYGVAIHDPKGCYLIHALHYTASIPFLEGLAVERKNWIGTNPLFSLLACFSLAEFTKSFSSLQL